MHFHLSASDRVAINGRIQIPCLLSILARWPLWAVSRQCKLIASTSELSSVHNRQVSTKVGFTVTQTMYNDVTNKT